MQELINKTARALVKALQSGEVTSDELLAALQTRIAEVDDKVNALPTLCIERAREMAARVNKDSPLAGLPIPIKDLTDVAGVRTTYGSAVSKNHIPGNSDLLVERIEAQGGLVYAKFGCI